MPPRNFEVVACGVAVGSPTPDLLRSWQERGSRGWVVGKQVEPGVWTSSAGPRDARTEFITLRPA